MTYRVYNGYCGLGGNAKNWTDCEVTAVDNNPEVCEVYKSIRPNDTVIIGDAHQYLLDHYDEFDFCWVSPPCPTHSRMQKATRHDLRRYPNMMLYQELIWLQHFFKGKYLVENVIPYYEPLIKPTQKVGRHVFWSNFDFQAVDVERPPGFINQSNLAAKEIMMDWLGIHYESSIYLNGNHCPVQALRNCCHPLIGEQILNAARNIKPPEQQFALSF